MNSDTQPPDFEAILKSESGRRTWNEWRKAHPKGPLPSLRGCNLRGAALNGINFEGVCLAEADLMECRLGNANFNGADLSGARCIGAHFENSDFSGAQLLRTNLSNTNLRRTNFCGATLSRSRLDNSDLFSANLRSADLGQTSLRLARFVGSDLTDAKFDGCSLLQTLLLSVNLSSLCEAKRVRHGGPSTVDFRSIALSAHAPNLQRFLRATGYPEIYAQYAISSAQALSAQDKRLLLRSVFISYGGPDEEFAVNLNRALLDQGVATFLFKVDAVPGNRLSRLMHEGVNNFDKMILVCSRDSLVRPGVLNELKQCLSREARDGGAEYLIPVRLDDFVFTNWSPAEPQLAREVKDRVIADFSDAASFSDQLSVLMRALLRIP